jgi:hypothetical protein
MHDAKTNLYTFGGKYGAGHRFHFVLTLMKCGAEMSPVTAVCGATDVFRKTVLISVTLTEIFCFEYLLILLQC